MNSEQRTIGKQRNTSSLEADGRQETIPQTGRKNIILTWMITTPWTVNRRKHFSEMIAEEVPYSLDFITICGNLNHKTESTESI